MALQTVDFVVVKDLSNPAELQTYFQNNPLIVITSIIQVGGAFYIIHT